MIYYIQNIYKNILKRTAWLKQLRTLMAHSSSICIHRYFVELELHTVAWEHRRKPLRKLEELVHRIEPLDLRCKNLKQMYFTQIITEWVTYLHCRHLLGIHHEQQRPC